MSRVLCIDDDVSIAATVERTLQDMGHCTTFASTVDQGLRALTDRSHDLVISDLAMPDASGPDLIRLIREHAHGVPIVITADYGNVEQAVQFMKLGAADYLTKPLRSESLRIAVRGAIEVDRLRRENDDAHRELGVLRGARRIVGDSKAVKDVFEAIHAVAATRATVLLAGESGTGKELFARTIHDQSPRRGLPFVTINCAALPEGLVENTLFGHERGATGANLRALGWFERAHRGTLLLDEIPEMRMDLQAKLLRAIQEQEFERVGGGQSVRVDVRIIATSNRNLEDEVEAGRFRRDLFYRINVVPIHTPPLRDHLEDLPQLVEHFVQLYAAEIGIKPPPLTPEAIAVLTRHHWPGNVRELANVVERGVIRCRGGEPIVQSFRASVSCRPVTRPDAQGAGEETYDIRTLERIAIQRALKATAGNKARAARLLGITERTLRNKLVTWSASVA